MRRLLALIAPILLAAALAGVLHAGEAPEVDGTTQVRPETPAWSTLAPRVVHTFSGIQYVILREGEGPKPVRDQVVQMHFVGRLLDGREFDSSYRSNQVYHCRVGVGFLIPGWDEMILDMRKGERRVALIPPELAYGSQGFPGEIPPNATLMFDMELVDF